jgi:two-component system, chemotaxis family, response regulator Rcp1
MDRTPLIVLAEDNATDVFLVRSALEQESLDVRLQVVEDGEQALRFLEEVENAAAPCPDLLLLDVNLPRFSGWEVLERVRQSTKCASISVVVMSSSNSPQDRERAKRLEVAHCFLKRADLKEFMKLGGVVRGLLRGDA